MSRNGTRRRARRRRQEGQWWQRFAWLLGGLFVCMGALAGAFGTVAWLTVLCVPSFPRLVVGVLSLGVAPVLGGGALLWTGLSLLEGHAARVRVHDLPEGQIIEAAHGGATAATVAVRLGVAERREVEQRLDALVVRDVLCLDVTEDGEILYAPNASEPHA